MTAVQTARWNPLQTTLYSTRVAVQPIVNAGDLSVHGEEVLLRPPQLGPEEFIARLSPSRRVEFERAHLRRSIQLMRSGHPNLQFNLTSLSLPDACEHLPLLTLQYGIDPAQLTLELTEHDYDAGALLELQQHGFKFVIDDLGNDHMRLKHLYEWPLHGVKLDRCMIQDPRARRMLGHLTGMCLDLGLDVTIEGIETPDHLDHARALGATRLQGYLLGRPVIVDHPITPWQRLLQRN